MRITVRKMLHMNTERLIADRRHMQTRNNSILKLITILFEDIKVVK